MLYSTGGGAEHARALFSTGISAGGLLPPNVCIRRIILGDKVEDGHLDTCATHCFVSTARSQLLTQHKYERIDIKPFPVGQGNPLPDATHAHIVPLWFITTDGQLVGFRNVLFLVCNTGADILISNNILDFLGILRYRPPTGYERMLEVEATRLFVPPERRCPPWLINPETLQSMLRKGQCLITDANPTKYKPLVPIQQHEQVSKQPCPGSRQAVQKESFPPFEIHIKDELKIPSNDSVKSHQGIMEVIQEQLDLPTSRQTFSATLCLGCNRHKERCDCRKSQFSASKQKESGKDLRQEIRKQKIEAAANLKVGLEPPPRAEITTALELLKKIADNPMGNLCSPAELKQLQNELSRKRPEWANCLTPAHTQTTLEEAKEAKEQIEHMMDVRFKDTVFAKSLKQPCSFPPFEIKQKPDAITERTAQPRRFKDPQVNKLIDEWIDGLLKDGLISESTTPVASPLTIVTKKGRDPRVCIDYRERNSRTEVPIFPMPDVHDFLDDAAGFKLYCSFDCTKMFNQYEIVKEHRHLAAFITQRGTFEPTRILFGLTGGPQHAVRSARPAMREHEYTNGRAFARWAIQQNEKGENPPYEIDPSTGIVPGSRLDIFIDDCRIPANKPKAMVKLCELWFLFCEEKRLILSRKKAKVCHTYLPLLGFVVSSEGKHLDPSRVASLLEVPTPTSKEGLHALLCSYNFVRMFVPDFSKIASPLYAATRGIIWKGPGSGRSKGTRNFDPEFIWTTDLERCLRQLQDALLKAPILSIPDYLRALYLSVDACLKGEGWVLWQIVIGEGGALVPVAIRYGSVKYGDTESTWEVTRQEAHAIQSALKDCYDYIAYCHFFLFTDHRNLTFMSDSVNRAVIRIRHYMQQFNMTVVHVPGTWNNPADGLSRLEKAELPVQQAIELNSATTTSSLEEFKTTTRGTDAGDPRSLVLEETDRVVCPIGKVLFTTNYNTTTCPHPEWCLLCSPNIPYGLENSGSQVLFTNHQLGEHSNEELLDQVQGPILESLGWDLIDEVNSSCYESRAFLTRQQFKEAALSWNTASKSTIYEHEPQKLGMLKQLPLDFDEDEKEWVAEPKLLEAGTIQEPGNLGSETTALETVDASQVNLEDCAGTPIPAQLEPKTYQCQITQTCPADFRLARLNFPKMEEFRSIHNNEEGHHGLAHSYRKLMKKFGSGWAETPESATTIREQLKQFIDNCPICQKIRGLQDRIKAKHSFIISKPFIEVSYDFVVFDKPDCNGNRYLLVAVDHFTKLVEMKAVPDRGAEGVARFLLELRTRYGPINRLRSDREKAFLSQIINKLNELAGTSTLPCVAYHPQANSVCERQNQIIMNHLRALVYGAKLGTDSMYSWTDLLPFVFSIVNNTPKMPLAISPLSMVYGIFANYDQPLLDPRPTAGTSNPVDYVDGLMEWQNRLLQLAEEIQSRHYERYKDKSANHRSFQEGDFVLQLKEATSITGKLVARWIGPRLVLARRDNDPTHPVLDLYDLVSSKVHEASIEDCRLMKTGWFDEQTLLQDMRQIAALDKEEYEVGEILEHRPPGPTQLKGTKPTDYWFKVKWAGFTEEENSWEPYSNLKDLEPLREYLQKFPKLSL